MNRIYVGCFVVLFLAGCGKKLHLNEEESAIYGLASPFIITEETAQIHLADYFNTPEHIEHFQFEYATEFTYDSVLHIIHLNDVQKLPEVSELTVKYDNYTYSIILIRPKKSYYTFRFDPKGKEYSSVKTKGTMNSWNPALGEMKLVDGFWQTTFYIKPGTYQYKLILDGVEKTDPNNPDSLENSMGGFNSLFHFNNESATPKPELYTLTHSRKSIAVGFTQPPDVVYALWENSRIKDIKIDTNHHVLTIPVPVNAKEKKRSFIRIYARNKAGKSNDIHFPLQYGKVIQSTDQLTRSDKHRMIMYFLMVDRFFDGNKNNNHPVNDPDILPKANHFGGDLQGVITKVNDGYFEKLGINTIWVSPITQNPLGAYGLFPDPYTKFSGYHGYWPISSTTVDFRFGNEHVLDSLVATIHKNDMNFLLDYVANHVHELHPVYLQHPDWATNLYLPDGSLNTEKWDEYRLTTWFDTFLPTLDLTRKEIVEPMTDSAVFWMKRFHIDGFRHDATKHIDELFWRTLTKKLKHTVSEDNLLYQIGETYGSRELISSYISSGMLDAQFDFSMYDDAVAVFVKDSEPFTRLTSSLGASLDQYGSHHLMGNITGNQDKARFISYAGGEVLFEEDAKKAGWKRDIGVGNPVAYKKLKLLHAWNMAIPGIPTIYYGDEIGMPGGNDPDNRRMMRFNNLNPDEADVLKTTSKLAGLRSASMPLIYGETTVLFEDDKSAVVLRTYFDQAVLIALNKDKTKRTMNVKLPERWLNAEWTSAFNRTFSIENETFSVTLEPYAFDYVLTK